MSAGTATSPVTAARRPRAVRPMLFAASSSAARPRATIATSAPEAAIRLATPSPIPLLPPVITAARPDRSMCIAPLLRGDHSAPQRGATMRLVPSLPVLAQWSALPPWSRICARAFHNGWEENHEAHGGVDGILDAGGGMRLARGGGVCAARGRQGAALSATDHGSAQRPAAAA